MGYSEYIKQNNIPKYNEFKEWYTLTDEQFAQLEKAVLRFLPTHTKNINYKTSTSYHLKGLFERILGFYLSNYDFKIVMSKLGYISGYKPSFESGKNPHYNISSKEVKHLEEVHRQVFYSTAK